MFDFLRVAFQHTFRDETAMNYRIANRGGVRIFATALVVLIGPRAYAQTASVGHEFNTMSRQTVFDNPAIYDFGWVPPDTMGAAGPNHIAAFDNEGFSVFMKSGDLANTCGATGSNVCRVNSRQFWTDALGFDPDPTAPSPRTGRLADPRILYDPQSQRWFAVMITTFQNTNNQILIARSNTADPTQGFNAASLQVTNGLFADFPTLGLDANGVYIGANNFDSDEQFASMSLYSIPKADLLTNTTATWLNNLTRFNVIQPGFTQQPAVNFGSKSASESTPILSNNVWFEQTGLTGKIHNTYNFTSLSGTTGPNATLSPNIIRHTNPYESTVPPPYTAPQAGTAVQIDAGDERVSGNAVQVGDYIYFVRAAGLGRVLWGVLKASTLDLQQEGWIENPDDAYYYYPSIAVNSSGDVVVGFSGSNFDSFASAYAVIGTSAGGPGGAVTFGTPIKTQNGQASYVVQSSDRNRWGDYSATTIDPADPGIFWTFQEWAAAHGTNTPTGNWATRADQH
jgi:hypothetical protein